MKQKLSIILLVCFLSYVNGNLVYEGTQYLITYNDSRDCFLYVNTSIDSTILCNPIEGTKFFLVDVPLTTSPPPADQTLLLSTVESFSAQIAVYKFDFLLPNEVLFGQYLDFPTANLFVYKVNFSSNVNVTSLNFSIANSHYCINLITSTVRVYLLVSQDNLFNNVFIDLQNMLYNYSNWYLSNEQFVNFNLTSGYNSIDLVNLYNFVSKRYTGKVNYIGIILMPENKLKVADSYCKVYNYHIKLGVTYEKDKFYTAALDSDLTFNTKVNLLWYSVVSLGQYLKIALTSLFTYNVNLLSNMEVPSLNFSIDNSDYCYQFKNLTMRVYLVVSQDNSFNNTFIDMKNMLYNHSKLYLSNESFVNFDFCLGYNSVNLVNIFNNAKNNYPGLVNYIGIIVIPESILQNDAYCTVNRNKFLLSISYKKETKFKGAVSFQSITDNKYLCHSNMIIKLSIFLPTDYPGNISFYVYQKDSYLSIQSAHPDFLSFYVGKKRSHFELMQNANVSAFNLVVIDLVIKSIVSINRYSINVTINSTFPVWNITTPFVIKCKDSNGEVNLYPVTNHVSIISSLKSYTFYNFSAGLKNEFGFYVYGQMFTFQTDEDVPAGYPLNFTVVTVNFTILKLSWAEVKSSLRKGIILNYVYSCNSDEDSVSNKVDNMTFNVEINVIYPDAIYDCSVAACTKFGCGVQAFVFDIALVNVTKTLWKVFSKVNLQGHILWMHLQIYPTFNKSLNAQVEFEYFLPPYFSFTSESVIQNFVKADGNRMKYYFIGKINSSQSFNYNFTALFNDTKCPMSGNFTLDIPLKISTQVELRQPTTLFKAFRAVVECFGYPKIPVVADKLFLKESYGRGIYWDEQNLNIYVCMNQHFPSTKVACYVSNDKGSLWSELDVRIGSVLGRHSLTKELYAIHRNQKTYMMFHSIHKKWLSITNQQFNDTASHYIDSTMRKNLEGDYNQIYTLGLNQWLGNAQGLFYLNENGSWMLRMRWRF